MNTGGTEESIWFSDKEVSIVTKLFLGVVLFILFWFYGVPKLLMKIIKRK